MQKITTMLFLTLFLVAKPGFAQFEDRFGYLNDQEIQNYVRPFATTLGMAFNSASYHDADVDDLFGFSFSIHGMYILIPEDEKTFSPNLPNGYDSDKQTATIYGDRGGAYSGPDGFKVYPPGLNQNAIPAGIPQFTFSLLGTELLLRYLPSIPVGDEDKISMLGVGLRHEISRYIPLLPVSVSAQVLYNNLEITNLLEIKNLAFNVHASKKFGIFVAYSGLQYESTSMDLTYTYKGDQSTELDDKEVAASLDGDNAFRFTLGGALKLGFFHINADVNLGTQTVFTTGLTFAF